MKKLFVALVIIIFGAAVYSESVKLGDKFRFTLHQFDSNLEAHDFIEDEVTSIQPISDGYYSVEVGKYKLTVKAGMEFNSFSGVKTERTDNFKDKPKFNEMRVSDNTYYNLCIIRITDIKPNVITYEIKKTNKQLVMTVEKNGQSLGDTSYKIIDVTN